MSRVWAGMCVPQKFGMGDVGNLPSQSATSALGHPQCGHECGKADRTPRCDRLVESSRTSALLLPIITFSPLPFGGKYIILLA